MINDAIELDILESLRLETLNLSQIVIELLALAKHPKTKFTDDDNFIPHLKNLEINRLVQAFPIGGVMHWQITSKGVEHVNGWGYLIDDPEEEIDRDSGNAWRELLEREDVGLYNFKKEE